MYEACGVHWTEVTELERARVTLGLATALMSLFSLAGIMFDLQSYRGSTVLVKLNHISVRKDYADF